MMNTEEALGLGVTTLVGATEATAASNLCSFGVAVLAFLDNWKVGSWKQWIVNIVANWLRGYLQDKGCI